MSTAAQRSKAIAKRLHDLKKLVDDNYPPALSGQNETDFVADANAAKGESLDQLDEPELSGFTPSLLSQPTGTEMVDWFVDMADDAETTLNASSPPTADLQRAADEYHTIAARTADLISAYT